MSDQPFVVFATYTKHTQETKNPRPQLNSNNLDCTANREYLEIDMVKQKIYQRGTAVPSTIRNQPVTDLLGSAEHPND